MLVEIALHEIVGGRLALLLLDDSIGSVGRIARPFGQMRAVPAACFLRTPRNGLTINSLRFKVLDNTKHLPGIIFRGSASACPIPSHDEEHHDTQHVVHCRNRTTSVEPFGKTLAGTHRCGHRRCALARPLPQQQTESPRAGLERADRAVARSHPSARPLAGAIPPRRRRRPRKSDRLELGHLSVERRRPSARRSLVCRRERTFPAAMRRGRSL